MGRSEGGPHEAIYVLYRAETQYLEITESLSQALQIIRHPYKSRVLWIDALCVNQHDVKERNVVVLQMKEIYYRATQVVICLGRGFFNSGYVPQAIMGINYALADNGAASGFANLDWNMQNIINIRAAPYNLSRDPEYMWENLRSWL